MQAGNVKYLAPEDFPEKIRVFPLQGALLLPGAQLPLNIFEPRYLAMFDAALATDRLIGIIQPALAEPGTAAVQPADAVTALAPMGCIGRITAFAETGDGRYLATLSGVCRFRPLDEQLSDHAYRSFAFAPFIGDLSPEDDEEAVDRDAILRVFSAYVEAQQIDVDWERVARAGNRLLVNSLSMISPFGAAEKQALLEAADLKSRAETLVAITEILLARGAGETDSILQ